MITPKHIDDPASRHAETPLGMNADLKGSLHALRRAAHRARQVAQQTGTDLIVVRSGQVVRAPPSGEPVV